MKQLLFLFVLIISSCSSERPNNYRKLDLSNKRLTSIPDSVLNMIDLDTLDLGSDFTLYPPLSAIIDSNANQISLLSEEIGNLTNLKALILRGNKLTALPYSISKMDKLEYIDLSFNTEFDIVKEIDKIKKLPKLKKLNIAFVSATQSDIDIIKHTLPNTQVIFSIQEFLDTL